MLDGARFDAGKAGASNVRAAPVSRVELMGLPAGAGAATVAQLCEDAGLSSVQLVRMRRDGTVHVDFGEPTDCSRAAEALKPSGIECLPPKLGPRHQGVLQWLMPYVRPEDHLLFAETVQSFRHGMST